MDTVNVVFLVLLVVSVAVSAKIPKYITPCRLKEPNLNACALKSARAAVPGFINGDRKYRIPLLDPLSITQLRVNEGVLGLNMTATDLKLTGLKQSDITNVDIDLKNRKVEYDIFIPRIEVNCIYDIQGRILILPITGTGPGNITLMNVTLAYKYNYDLPRKKDGFQYVTLLDSQLIFNTTRLYIKLENLFNGNKLLGDQMNVFMDENWKELVRDIGPIIGESVSETMRRILSNIFDLVPWHEAFPDKP